MKHLFSLVLLTASLSLFSQTTPYVNSRGCVVCDMLTAGATFNLNGATYTVVDRPLLETMRDNGSDLSKVCVSLVTDMSTMFFAKYGFNADISSWDVSNVSNMYRMFYDANAFNQDISSWDVSNVTDMSGMLSFAYVFNQDIGGWDVSNVTTMAQMFTDAYAFNQDIGAWDVFNVTSMLGMFIAADNFNQDIGLWDVSNVSDMSFMFHDLASFNQDLSGWCVTNIPTQPTSFSSGSPLTAANHPVWGTCPSTPSIVYNPDSAYVNNRSCVVCDQYAAGDTFSLDNGATWYTAVDRPLLETMRDNGEDLSKVCVSLVGDMSTLFQNKNSFNDDISSWDVSNVTNMSYMFTYAFGFDQDISNWDVKIVTNMRNMFQYAFVFNQDIGDWDVRNVANMRFMFNGAGGFNQDLSQWCVNLIPATPNGFSTGSALTSANMPVWGSCPSIPLVYNPNNAYINGRGCLVCDNYTAGDNFSLDSGATWYTAVNRNLLLQKRDNGDDLSKVCVSLVSDMDSALTYIPSFNDDISGWDVSNVTDMRHMFTEATSFNQDISNWDMDSVVSTMSMFYNASSFNQDLNGWDLRADTSVAGMFRGATSFNGNIGAWDMASSVTDASGMFRDATSFNQDISSWDMSNITNMRAMFQGATAFAQDITSWDVSSVTSMARMFRSHPTFNQDLSGWDISSLEDINSMFWGASSFNQDLGSWDVGSITNMSNAFREASAFNQDLSRWDVSSVTAMSGMFRNASSFSQDLSLWCVPQFSFEPSGFSQNSGLTATQLPVWGSCPDLNPNNAYLNSRGCLVCDQYAAGDWFSLDSGATWNKAVDKTMLIQMRDNGDDLSKVCVSLITNMDSALAYVPGFNQDISSWDVSNVTSMFNMFAGATSFDGSIGNWDMDSVENTLGMFYLASAFNQDISSWDMGSDTTMAAMFRDAISFNQDISAWDVSSVNDLTTMFRGASSFNGSMPNWDVGSVSKMAGVFRDAVVFNGDISNWNTSAVTTMNGMFQGASSFAADISAWDVSSVENMTLMFKNATNYNGDLSAWYTASATNMTRMFNGATNFNQDLSGWCVGNITTAPSNFSTGSALTAANMPVWGTCFCPSYISFVQDTVALCGVGSYSIDAGSGFSSYQWSTGDSTQTITVSNSGLYSCTVSDNGCFSTDSIFISLLDASINASDSVVCAGDSVLLFNQQGVAGLGLNQGSLNFDGINSEVVVPASPSTSSLNHITLSCWAISDGLNGNEDYLLSSWSGSTSANRFLGFRVNTNGNPSHIWTELKINGSYETLGADFTNYTVAENVWNHFALTYDGYSIRLYQNGLLVGSKQITGTLDNNPNDLVIGECDANCNGADWNGNIDDLTIWNRALSLAEIQEVMNCGVQPNSSGIIAHWDFENKTGQIASDQSGNNNNGNLNLGCSWSARTPNYTCVSSNITYSWSTGDTTASITANPTQTTTYYCTVSDGISTCTDSVTVYVNSPVVDLGADTLSVCGQDSVLLDAGAGHSSYLWNTGETTQTIYADASGTYSVEVSDGTPSSNSNSLSFDGINDYITLGNDSKFQIAKGTYEAWVNTEDAGTFFRGIVVKREASGLFLLDNELVVYDWTIPNTISTGLFLDDSAWHHIAFVFDDGIPNGSKLYLDGIEVKTFTYNIASQSVPMTLGWGNSGNQFYSGLNGGVRIWNTALTQTEVQQYMSCPPTGNEAGLVGYWNFEEGSGSVANDLSGNGNNGTINGASWSSDVPSQSCGLGCTATDSVYVNLLDASISASDSVVCAGDSVTLSAGGGMGSATSSALPAYLPTNGLVAWYPFNGNANDESGNSLNAIQNSASLDTDRFGTPNSAYKFNGNAIEFIELPFLNISGNQERTVSIWVNAISNNGYNAFLCMGNSASQGATWEIGLNWSCNQGVYVDCRWDAVENGTNSISDGNWHHVVTVFPAGAISLTDAEIYVDGILQPICWTYGGSVSVNTSASSVILGKLWDNSRRFSGVIDDVVFYDRALTNSEIQSLYTGQAQTQSTDLSFNWSTGDTTQSIKVIPSQTTTYYCTVSDGISTCTDSVTVYVNSPVVDLGADTLSVCGQDSVLLDAGAGHSSYLWNTGETTQTIYADASGTYSVEVSDGTPSSNSSSLSFDGVDDEIVLNNIVMDDSFSFDTYVFIPSTADLSRSDAGRHIFSTGANNSSWASFAFGVSDITAGVSQPTIICEFGNPSSSQFAASQAFPLDTWVHIVITFSNGELNVYQNGISVLSNSTGIVISPNSVNTRIGNRGPNWGTNAYQFDGFISYLSYWNTALTQTEVQQYMSCPPTGNEAGLVGYWNFEEGSGSVANDLSGNGNHGTINGATWSSDVPSQSCGLGCTATDSVYVDVFDAAISATDSAICVGDTVLLTAGDTAASALTNNLPNYLPTTGITAHFDFKNNNLNDISGNGGVFQNFGGHFTIDEDGNSNSALEYYGSNTYSQVNLNQQITGDFSIFLRLFNPVNNDGTYDKIISFPGDQFDLMKSSDELRVYPAPSHQLLTTPLQENKWTDIYVTRINGVLLVYLDGVLSDSLPFSSTSNFGSVFNVASRYYLAPSECGQFTLSELIVFSTGQSVVQTMETYSWSTGDTTASITANPAQTTTYYCTVSNGISTCTDSVTVYVQSLPVIDLGPDSIASCDSLVLDAGAGFDSYLWNTGETSQTISANQSGTYWAMVSQNGCSATDSVYVGILDASIRAASSCVSVGDSITLTAGGLIDTTIVQLGADIDGEASEDWFGGSVSLSIDGNRVAIGASKNDDAGTEAGHTRVYQWNGSAWSQMGGDIDGNGAWDESGFSVSLSSNGTRVAIGAPTAEGQNDIASIGVTKVYEWDGNTWIQLGADIEGEAASDRSGWSVSLSSAGDVLAISAPFNDGNGANSGHVRVYQWDGVSWNQVGNDIDGESAEDFSGKSISLSGDGNTIAIGASSNDDAGANAGHTRVYQWNGSAWSQMGGDIDGEFADDRSGHSVSLSTGGGRVAIGAFANDGNGGDAGHTRVFEWSGTAWNQLGNDLDGENGNDWSGYSVSLSSEGARLAVGGIFNDGNGGDAGHTRVFEWSGTAWGQIDLDIEGEAAGDNSGHSVSISGDGNRVAIGAIKNDDVGTEAGHVRVFSIPTQLSLSYNWSTGDSTQSITVSPAQATTYSCTISDGTLSCTDSVTIDVAAGPSIDSVVAINANQGVYMAYFNSFAGGLNRLEYKGVNETTWKVKYISYGGGLAGYQKFNIIPRFNTQVEVRLASFNAGLFDEGCPYIIDVPCKNMILQMAEQKSAFCAGDSALVRVGIAGGYGTKSIMWSNGATTKRTYAQQGETLYVTVTDATGCSLTDSITGSVLSAGTAPTNLVVTRSGALITGTWNASVLGSNQTLIGYRMAYRLRGTQTWTNTPLTSNTTYTMDWTGSGIPAGNYEFVVFARYRENGVATNSNFSCITVKGYNGVGGKSEGADLAEPTDVPNISVYPNPTDNILYIQAPENSSLILIDMNGKTLTQLTTEAVETSIDMSSYAQGVYMLQIQTGEAVETRRIVRK